MKRNVFFLAALLVISIQQIAAQNVGIGTTTPTQKLDVNGNVNISGTILTNGTSGTSGQVLTNTGTGLAWTSIGSNMGYKKCNVYMVSGNSTFSVPAGVSEVMVELWGAGSGGSAMSGGTSGGYARTVQTVSPGSTISFSIGQGTASGTSASDAGNTSASFPNGTNITAYGGGGATFVSGTVYRKGFARSGYGTVTNAFYMVGSMGEANVRSYAAIGNSTYLTTFYGEGGAPVGLLNSNPIKGAVQYEKDGVITELVIPNIIKTPSAGAPALASTMLTYGGDGMVIFWYN